MKECVFLQPWSLHGDWQRIGRDLDLTRGGVWQLRQSKNVKEIEGMRKEWFWLAISVKGKGMGNSMIVGWQILDPAGAETAQLMMQEGVS